MGDTTLDREVRITPLVKWHWRSVWTGTEMEEGGCECECTKCIPGNTRRLVWLAWKVERRRAQWRWGWWCHLILIEFFKVLLYWLMDQIPEAHEYSVTCPITFKALPQSKVSLSYLLLSLCLCLSSEPLAWTIAIGSSLAPRFPLFHLERSTARSEWLSVT